MFWARIVACDPGEVSGPKYPYVGTEVCVVNEQSRRGTEIFTVSDVPGHKMVVRRSIDIK